MKAVTTGTRTNVVVTGAVAIIGRRTGVTVTGLAIIIGVVVGSGLVIIAVSTFGGVIAAETWARSASPPRTTAR